MNLAKLILGLGTATLLAPSAIASNNGGVCVPVSAQQEIDSIAVEFTDAPLRHVGHIYLKASEETVYRYATDETLIVKWMQGIRRAKYDNSTSNVSGALGEGSTRTLTSGFQPDFEVIELAQSPNLFAYRITEGPPLKNHIAIMRVQKAEDNGVVFSWYQYFDAAEDTNTDRMTKRVRRFVTKSQKKLVRLLGGDSIDECR